jgi:stage V sporulation protein B
VLNIMSHSSSDERSAKPSPRVAARGTLQLMIGRLSFFAFGYLVSVVIARTLGPVEYGVYGVILSVLVWVEQIGRFGIPEALLKLAPEDEERRPRLEQTTQTLLTVLFLGLFATFWVATPMLVAVLQIPDASSLFRLAILDIPVSGLFFAHQGILAGRRNFGAVSGALVVYAFSKLCGILIALLVGLSLYSAVTVNIVGTVGALVYSITQGRSVGWRPSLRHTGLMLRLALPIGCYLLGLQILFNLDLWSLKIIGVREGEVIGAYVAALNIARLPALAFAVVNGVLLPSLAMALVKQDAALAQRYVQGAGRFLWVTLLPSCVLLALTAQELMVFLYSNQYALGGTFLMIQVFAFGLFGLTQVFSEMLIARGQAYLTAAAILGHIPVAVCLNVLLIPYAGAVGAATALALTAGCVATVTGFLAYKRFGPMLESATFFKVLLATAVTALAATQISAGGGWLLPEYVFLLVLYNLMLTVLGELTWDDLRPFALWQKK